ncbi:TPA: hypothetical protein O8U14_004576 [Enterobacter asburiae]|nr:hypothetical protein [Enterobacter asburiae]
MLKKILVAASLTFVLSSCSDPKEEKISPSNRAAVEKAVQKLTREEQIAFRANGREGLLFLAQQGATIGDAIVAGQKILDEKKLTEIQQ